MRRISVGLVSALLVVAGCTSDDPVVAEASTSDSSSTTAAQPTVPAEAELAEEDPVQEDPVEEDAVEEDPVEEDTVEEDTGDGLFPVVVGATASMSDATAWRVSVTLSSEYDSPERYADAWRVLDDNDNELGIRVLGHDHANEQPFTRSHTIEIPSDLTTVFIEGRDQVNGWSGERYELMLER